MKKEELFETINNIDNKYLEIAETFASKKKRKIWMKSIVTVACLFLVLGLIINKQYTSDRSVTVYAFENGSEKKQELNHHFSQIAEYSMIQSSVPALCFQVEVNFEISEISAKLLGEGKLLKYKVDEEGIWHVIESGKTLKYEKNEMIYWAPASSSDNTTILLNIYFFGKLKETIKVVVEPNDSYMGYVAKIN